MIEHDVHILIGVSFNISGSVNGISSLKDPKNHVNLASASYKIVQGGHLSWFVADACTKKLPRYSSISKQYQ